MTLAEVLPLYGGSREALAAALGCSRQATYRWSQTGPIPPAHYLMLRYQLKPDAFRKDGSLRKVAA